MLDLIFEYLQEFRPLAGRFHTQFGSFGLSSLHPHGGPHLNDPYGLVADDLHVYVCDTMNHRIQKFNYKGDWVASFGKFGTGQALFKHPFHVTLGPKNTIMVSDEDNHRIQVIDKTGGWWVDSYHLGFRCCKFVPWGENQIYACDMHDRQVVIYDRTQKRVVRRWGPEGIHALSRFRRGYWFNLDMDEAHVYVTDELHHCVRIFDHYGRLHRIWSEEYNDIRFVSPSCVHIHDDEVYVGDQNGVKIIDKAREELKQTIGSEREDSDKTSDSDTETSDSGSEGGWITIDGESDDSGSECSQQLTSSPRSPKEGEFSKVQAIYRQRNFLFVLDSGNARIQVFQ